MRRMGWAVTAAATAAVAIGGARVIGADGQNDERGRSKQCSEATVRGDYGIQIQGTRPAPESPEDRSSRSSVSSFAPTMARGPLARSPT